MKVRGRPLETGKTGWLSSGSLREQASRFSYPTKGCEDEMSVCEKWVLPGCDLSVDGDLLSRRFWFCSFLAISVVAPSSPTPWPSCPRRIVLFHCLHSTHRCLICSHSCFVLLAAACVRSERAGISPVFFIFASPVFKIA